MDVSGSWKCPTALAFNFYNSYRHMGASYFDFLEGSSLRWISTVREGLPSVVEESMLHFLFSLSERFMTH